MNRCVSIINTNNYPNVLLIGVIDSVQTPSIRFDEWYEIKSSECLHKGYKLNNFYVYAVDRAYVEKAGLQNIDFNNKSVVLPANLEIEPVGWFVENSDPLVQENIEYLIMGFTDEYVVLCEKSYKGINNDGSETANIFSCPPDNTLRQTLFKCRTNQDCDQGTLCNINTGKCVTCLNDTDCDDGIFCNGQEKCDENNKCQPGIPPCSTNQMCKEDLEECWDTIKLDGYCIPQVLYRPFFREEKYSFVYVMSNNFHINKDSLYKIEYLKENGSGISFYRDNDLFILGNSVFVPLLIKQTATTGTWKIAITTETEISEKPTIETAEAVFVVE